MTLSVLKRYCERVMGNYPDIDDEVMALYQLAVDNVEDGASEAVEFQVTVDAVEDLIEENGGY